MSGLNTVLTAGNLADLRAGRWQGNQYISLCPNDNILATTVSAAPSTNPFATLAYAGAGATVVKGMTVLLSKTDDRRAAYWRGRVRESGVASPLHVNETSVEVEAGDYLWVLDDYDLHAVLARESGGVQYKDYDNAYHTMRPLIYNLQSGYADWVDTATGFYRIAFDAQGLALEAGAAIDAGTWQWDAGDGVFAVGTDTDPDPTIDFPPGFRWVHVQVDDDNGVTGEFHFPVWAHAPASADDPYPPEYGFRGAEIRGTLGGGWNATVEAFDGVDDVLDQTLVCIWTSDWYGTDKGPLRSNVDFIGRLRTESNTTDSDDRYALLADAQFEIEGPIAQLQRLHMQPLRLRYIAAPDEWDELNGLGMLRAICHVLTEHSTFCTLHSLEFDDAGGYYIDELEVGREGGNLYDALRDVASGVNANIEMDAQGRARVARDGRYLTEAERAAMDTVADWDGDTDWIVNLEIQREHAKPAGQVWAFGGSYNTATDETIVVGSYAHGEAHEQGADTVALNNQVLLGNVVGAAAQAELNQRCGDHLAATNPPPARLTVQHPDGFHSGVLSPTRRQWFTWTLDAGNSNIRGYAYDDTVRWFLTELTTTHYNDRGMRDVQATYEQEQTYHPDGQTFEIPESTIPNITITTPPQRPQVTIPTTSLPTKLVALMGNGHVARATSYTHPTAPDWEDITGGVMTGDCGSPGGGGNAGGYLYEDLWVPERYYVSNSDGLWKTDDIWASPPVWSLVNNNALLCGVRKLVQSIYQAGWMAALVAEGPYGSGRVIYSTDNFATIAGTVPYPTGVTTYKDISPAQGGRATGAGSGVQLYLLGHDGASVPLYIVYSGDGGVTVTRRGTPGRTTDSFTPLITYKFTVPVFDNAGAWNTDGDLHYVGAMRAAPSSVTDVRRSQDAGATFDTFYSGYTIKGNFANVTAGAMQDNRYLAWVLHRQSDNDRRIYFSADYGATWYNPPDLGVSAHRIRYSDAWAGVNGYSYHTSWFVWWRNENALTTPDVFVTDDAGLSASSIQGTGATNLFTVTGQGTGSGSFPNIISVQADISDLGWLFAPGI